MKSFKYLLVSLIGLTLLSSCGWIFSSNDSNSQNISGDFEYRYNKESGEYSVFSYKGNDDIVTIPEKVKTGDNPEGKVTSIFSYSFRETKVHHIKMPDTIVSIGDSAFEDCASLETINFSNNLKSIGKLAFDDCKRLHSIALPDSATNIDKTAFGKSTNPSYLIDISIGSKIKNIDFFHEISFDYLISISVSINNPYYCNDERGIIYSKDMSELIFCPSGIDDEIVVKDSVTKIGYRAFSNSKATNIILPDTLQDIGEDVFLNSTLTWNSDDEIYMGSESNPYLVLVHGDNGSNITVNENTKFICDYAFGDNSKKTSIITIPEGVKFIGQNAFYRCPYLNTITLPNSLETLKMPTGLSADNKRLNYNEMDGSKYIGNSENPYLLLLKASNDEQSNSFTFDPSTKFINDYAFSRNSNLTYLKIGSNIKEIGTNSFYECENLSTVKIENGLVSVGDNAFENCNNLTSITLPDSVTTLGYKTFSFNSFTKFKIPNKVKEIPESCFYECHLLETLEIGAESELETICEEAFEGCSKLKATNSFVDCFELPKKVISVEKEAFNFCLSLTSLIIHDSLVYIGESAFESGWLETVYYDGSLNEWEQVERFDNDSIKTKIVHFCSKEKPTINEGDEISNYRYYDEEGNPTIWSN